ncbi:MAG: OsmC family protein [Candidatus Obscuribacter sp.]|nr:OsmC family protein [Candidatus Obscuribacter sp.]
MPERKHTFSLTTTWVGDKGTGTDSYTSYSRDFEASGGTSPDKDGKVPVAKYKAMLGSSDPAFRGDASRYNPEEMLIGALSSCHMLWMLHLCADSGIILKEYVDEATGYMDEVDGGGGQFTSVVLRPKMKITDASRIEDALALHAKAHQKCFIARSVNFTVSCEPTCTAL